MFCKSINKDINFNKNKAESKMKNLAQDFTEKNLVLQLVNCELKVKL